ncbi:hypothetical protein AYI70_g6567 [Smittium culicis]|uniref:Putative sensor domain-containing protein n=1 Tax=Smittium culicis TaxID=133412 RepID=A0A1R1XPD2_9FUNG|nr:hypothetical protein AYI70_g6567 [Smittium culicis]
MVQVATLNEVDLSVNISSLGYQAYNISPPAPAKLHEVMFAPEYPLDEKTDSNSPPPYTPALINDSTRSSTEKNAQLLTVIDMSTVSGPPLYTESKPMFLPTPSSVCVGCSSISTYFGSLKDYTNWSAAFYQLFNFTFGIPAFMIVFFLFMSSASLLVLFPVGLALAWVSAAVARSFANFEVKSLQIIKSHSDNCINCRKAPLESPSYPKVILKSKVKKGFFAGMLEPLKDSYTWRATSYFMFVKPITSILGLSISFVGLTLGIFCFPILPACLKVIKAYSFWEKDLSMSILSPKQQ